MTDTVVVPESRIGQTANLGDAEADQRQRAQVLARVGRIAFGASAGAPNRRDLFVTVGMSPPKLRVHGRSLAVQRARELRLQAVVPSR
jgi:hypothetical protein